MSAMESKPCQHKWHIKERFVKYQAVFNKKTGDTTKGIEMGTTFLMVCQVCGDMKNHNV
jgi:hypothetical protein